MRALPRAVAVLTLTLLAVLGLAQDSPGPVVESGHTTWSAALKRSDVRAGETVQIVVTGKLEDGWHAFGPQLEGEWVNISSEVPTEGNSVTASGDLVFPAGFIDKVPGFEKDAVMYEHEFAFGVPVKVSPDAQGKAVAVLKVRAQNCDATSCDRPRTATLTIEFDVAPGDARPEFLEPDSSVPQQPAGYVDPPAEKSSDNYKPGSESTGSESGTVVPDDSTSKGIAEAKGKGLLAFMLLAFGAGLLALLTPCVWPMIPITVSYFTKKSEEGPNANIRHAVAYCLGIMGTFVGLGLVMTLIYGAAGVQKLAASPIANGFLGLLFVVLALNLFGAFEIIVPTGLVNKIQAKSKKGGYIGTILLGFVFSLTTFTCTVPFVGTILVSASSGDLLFPTMGMLAFSAAFALPFFGLAMTPKGIAKLPKSGTWLSAVKAYMGFLELAAAFKFLSNIDVVVNDPIWVPMEAFAGLWSAVFICASLYLFGWLRTPSDDGKVVGTARKLFGLFNVLIAGWVLAGVQFPAVLGSFLGFFPPAKSQQTGLTWEETYEAGLAKAKAEGKPLFVNFTGKTCGNCRVMEYQRFPRPEYRQELDKFVRAELFTDRETPEDDANAELREKMTQSATNPTYAIVNPETGQVVAVFQGLALNDADFIEFLKQGFQKASP